MREIWRKLEAQLGKFPGALENIRPEVSSEAVSAAERVLGSSLPNDFKESLQIHDGGYDQLYLIGTIWLYPLKKSMELANPKRGLLGKLFRARAEPVRRLPIGDDGCIWLELDLETGPNFGAVRALWEDGDEVIFGSFRNLLEAASRDIEAGVLRYDFEEQGFLVSENPENSWLA